MENAFFFVETKQNQKKDFLVIQVKFTLRRRTPEEALWSHSFFGWKNGINCNRHHLGSLSVEALSILGQLKNWTKTVISKKMLHGVRKNPVGALSWSPIHLSPGENIGATAIARRLRAGDLFERAQE